MHEVGIMQSAVDTALAHLRAQRASRLHRLVLRVGALSGVDPESLRFAFDAATRRTPAEGATLEIQSVPPRARCPRCDLEFEVESGFVFPCPTCGRLSGELVRGRELELARIEMS